MKLNNRILFCSCLFLVKSASVLSSKYFFWTYCLSWFNNPFVWKPKRKKQKQACKAASINLSLMFNRKEMWKDQDILISLSIIRNFKNRLYIWIKNDVLNVEKQHESLRMSQLLFILLNLPPNLKYFKSKLLFIPFCLHQRIFWFYERCSIWILLKHLTISDTASLQPGKRH